MILILMDFGLCGNNICQNISKGIITISYDQTSELSLTPYVARNQYH